MKTILVSISILIGSVTCFTFSQQNILLIIADDIGADYTNGYNSPIEVAPTPNIDCLAEQGLLFENFWATPFCSPTRATLLTGRHGFRTGVGAPVGGPDRPGLLLDEYTLPQAIKDMAPYSYTTACFGKWHLSTNKNGKDSHPNLAGFDLYAGNTSGEVEDYYAWKKTTNGTTDSCYTYSATEYVNNAITFIDTVQKPWFIWLAFNNAHTPFHRPPDSLHSYISLNNVQLRGENVYDYLRAMAEAMDTETGRLIQQLKNKGIYSNTHIIYMADNGTTKKAIQSPFSKDHSKGSLYNGGIHVPLLIKSKMVTKPGSTCEKIVESADIFQTILEFSGINNFETLPNITDSKSLVPLLVNAENHHKEWIFSQNFGHDFNQNGVSIRNTHYHLMVLEDSSQFLFKISEDRYETNNLLTQTLTEEEKQHYNRLYHVIDSMGVIPTPSIKRPRQRKRRAEVYYYNGNLNFSELNVSEPSIIRLHNTDGKTLVVKHIAGISELTFPIQLNTDGVLFVSIENEGNLVTKKYLLTKTH